jgi:hypothetical protein
VRRGLLWLLVLPSIVVGSQVAHGVAYWWAYPQANLRLAVLSRSGHGYYAYAPAVLGALAAIQLIAFAVVVLDRLRGRPMRSLPAWAFLLIPELAFVLQEHLERLLKSGVFPWWTALEPSFWRGLVLQVPLGIAAYLVALLLLRTATALADAVVARRDAPAVARRRPTTFTRPAPVFLPRLTPLAALAADRAPPVAPA